MGNQQLSAIYEIVKRAILSPLASRRHSGFDLLKAVLGEDPIWNPTLSYL
ncbi:MAG: hypothetical protein R2776_04605 [Flavobacteriaceae bacterium]